MAFSRPHLLRFAGLALAVGLVAFAGCSSSSNTAVPVTHPTMIRVEPEDFLGAVPCDLNGPGLKRYVATLVDRNYGEGGAGSNALGEGGSEIPQGGAEGFQAPSSLPTPCTTGTGFGFVVPGRRYEVFIDGYDTDALAPRALGSPEMVPTDVATDPVHTAVLKPRWRAKCLRAVASDSTIVRADECEPFQADDQVTTGQLRVALSPLLGSLACGSEQGQINHFGLTVTLEDGTELTQSVSCSEGAQAIFAELPAGQRASVYVEAFGGDSVDAFAGALCTAAIQADASIDATCAALSGVGTVQVDLQAALAQLGTRCDRAAVSNVTVKLLGDMPPRELPPPDCLQPFSQGFPVGDAYLVVGVIDASGEHSLSCTARVMPGRVVTATCSPNTAD